MSAVLDLGLNLGVLAGLGILLYGLYLLGKSFVDYMRPVPEDRSELDAALERLGDSVKARNQRVGSKPRTVDDEVPF